MTSPTVIILARHGETEWNRMKIFRGVYDVPLNENGRAQAKLLGKALAGRRIDVAYSSPLSRARETAELALSRRDVEIKIHPGFADIDYGLWTGLSEEDVAAKWPAELAAWKETPHGVRIPGGGSLSKAFEISFSAMEDILLKNQGRAVAIFAHRVVNKLLVLGALGLGIERFPFIMQDNCCVNEFVRTARGYIVYSLNDVSHIRGSNADLLTADF